jgi:transcriptional regulator with XRE-family HTH domain
MQRTIREWRMARSLTQASLAATTRVPPATFFRWETGKVRPQPAQLHALANALGVAADDIKLLSATRPGRAR